MRYKNLVALAGLVALGSAGCADLEVTNLNEPDRARALSRASDVEALIAGAFQSWWYAGHDWGGGPAISVAADEHTASWGNFGMQEMSWEPRRTIPNDPSWSYAYALEDPWTRSYQGLSALRDGISAVLDGVVELDEEERALAFGRILQGMNMGQVALLYDQGFVLDETTVVEEAEMIPYDQLMDAAIARLDEGISIAQSADFSIPSSWVGNFDGVDSDMLAQIGNSIKARYLASVGRSVAERDAAPWGQIAAAAEAGVDEDFGPISTGGFSDSDWYDILKSYGGTMHIWARTDMRMLGPADISGQYEAWLALPPEQRTEYVITTPDRRVTGSTEDGTVDGLWFQFHGQSFFRPERGTYHFSMYGDKRFEYYLDPFVTGFAPDMTVREMDFLRAEAYLRGQGGTEADAIEIINQYRVGNGELPAATAAGTPDGPDTCVPQMPDGSCGDLWEVLQYDKRIEVWHTGFGIAFWDDRGWGDLVSGTALHFPVPASTLQTLLMDIYTFGGGGEGSAPVPARLGFDITETPQSVEDLDARLEAWKRVQRARDQSRPAPVVH